MTITIKNETEIRLMEEAGQVVALVHSRIERAIAPGVSTADLDEIARDTLNEAGAVSSFLGYHGFPAHICASVNDEIVHGIPGQRLLREGDIISVDAAARSITLDVSSTQIAARLAAWTPPPPRYTGGVMAKYARLVGSASEGAVTAATTHATERKAEVTV
jgi:methionine aminopeptidase